MASQASQPERVQTDESLRNERKNADEALTVKRSAEEVADKLVDRARSKADAVLDKARDKADDKLAEVGTVIEELHQVVASERAQEDVILQKERAAADERLRLEREEQAAILEAPLSRERANTDRSLLTERDRADDAIANRDDFLGMVSHDLRNLLHSISLTAEMLSAAASVSEEGKRTVEGMNRVQLDVSRMGRIIEDLVDIVSIDAGKLSIRAESSDAADLLKEVVDSFAKAAADKGISLSVKNTDAPVVAHFDHQRVFQVLANCLSNAIKFTPSSGQIVVSCKRTEDNLHFSISDTGTGIPENMLDEVFERFWQVGKNDRRGLGLGLYISKCIVVGHGGSIWVESQVGTGSTFHFTIPKAASAGA